MASFARLSTLAPLSLLAALAACGGAAASGGTGPAPLAAPTNTSMATARPLAVGETADFTLPCEGDVWFGPFEMTADPQRVWLTSTARSVDGAQVCGGGDWVDGAEAFVQVAGLGCTQDADVAQMEGGYEYAPSSGAAGATPVYVRFRIADPRPESCASTLAVTLTRTE